MFLRKYVLCPDCNKYFKPNLFKVFSNSHTCKHCNHKIYAKPQSIGDIKLYVACNLASSILNEIETECDAISYLMSNLPDKSEQHKGAEIVLESVKEHIKEIRSRYELSD